MPWDHGLIFIQMTPLYGEMRNIAHIPCTTHYKTSAHIYSPLCAWALDNITFIMAKQYRPAVKKLDVIMKGTCILGNIGHFKDPFGSNLKYISDEIVSF